MTRLRLVSLAIAMFACAGCGSQPPAATVTEQTTVTQTAPATTPSTESAPPAQDGAPTASLKELLASQSTDNADYRDPVKSGALVTQGFVSAVEDGSRDLGYLDFNPFLCSQQLPEKIDYVDESIDGDQARVTAVVKYGAGGGETQVYDMALDGGTWKLDRSECMG
ncbi:MAG: hypothetical protein QOG62_2200 [Thermoleophilaceae bacterium]|jgi:hypothetical protein|nr:hypothetical protein [Thermoleophilaceae bacterium]